MRLPLVRLVVTGIALGALATADARAQVRPRPEAVRAPSAAGGVRIRELLGIGPRGFVKTPEYSTSLSRGRASPRDWAEMAVVFDTDDEWMDEITVQFYALVYDKVKDEHQLFRGSVTHVDVARGKGHQSAMYLRPSTVARYGGVVALAVEIVAKGEIVAAKSDGQQGRGQKLPDDWWKKFPLPPKEGQMLNRNQTPFAFTNWDDYEAVK
jgi:hypothetical protein